MVGTINADAAFMAAVALTAKGRDTKQRCRKRLRGVIKTLQRSRGLPAIRLEAVRIVERGCLFCAKCEGIKPPPSR